MAGKKKYLTEEAFEKFRSNDFESLRKMVWRIEGSLYILIPLVIAILGIVLAIVLR